MNCDTLKRSNWYVKEVVKPDWQRRGLLPRDVGTASYTDVAEGDRSRQRARYIDTAATAALFARSGRLDTSTNAEQDTAGPYMGALSSLATTWDFKKTFKASASRSMVKAR